ncbi:MAG: ketopantoate reductase family protein [Anaerolineales bacterium]|nr:ketopantoate reductase family protein [Anaerolineales bacterium]
MSAQPLNVLVFGAGAIGGYLGGSLALRSQRVVFVERRHNAPALRERGLRLEIGEQVHHLKDFGVVTSLDEALAFAPFDVALFALKSYDTAEALDALRPHAAVLPAFLCLQNGVENEAALAAVLGDDKVIAGTVTTAVAKDGPGQLRLERLRGVGLYSGHPLSARLAAAFDDASLRPQLYPSAAGLKWSKLLTNLLVNASCALLDMTPAEVMADRALFALEMRGLREALAVMRAKGLRVTDLPGTPVRGLALAAGLPLPLGRLLLRRAVAAGRGGKMPSLHIDLYGGRGRSEVDWLNGAVARAAAELGLPAPVNSFLNQALNELVADPAQNPYRHNPDRLLAALPA